MTKGAKLAISDPDISKSEEEFGKALGIVLRESEDTTGDDDELFHESDEEEEEGDEDEEDDLEPM